jgi:predicted HTH domain antitoxin
MKIALNIPDDIGVKEFDLKMIFAVALYNNGIVSSGYAADLIGIERKDFIENMGRFGGNILEIPLDQVKQDAENARRFIQ